VGCGEQAIRRDLLIKEHGLSDGQAKAIGHMLEYGSLTIKDCERIFTARNRMKR
jgi:hypothetical protein